MTSHVRSTSMTSHRCSSMTSHVRSTSMTSHVRSTSMTSHTGVLLLNRGGVDLNNRPFYITGESYAGVYIPMIIEQIDLNGKVPNFAGAMIGNGCWGSDCFYGKTRALSFFFLSFFFSFFRFRFRFLFLSPSSTLLLSMGVAAACFPLHVLTYASLHDGMSNNPKV